MLKIFDSQKTSFKSYGVMTLDIFCTQWIYTSTVIHFTSATLYFKICTFSKA